MMQIVSQSMMRCLPDQNVPKAHIISVSGIIALGFIICPIGQTSFRQQKNTLSRAFCWRRGWDSLRRYAPTRPRALRPSTGRSQLLYRLMIYVRSTHLSDIRYLPSGIWSQPPCSNPSIYLKKQAIPLGITCFFGGEDGIRTHVALLPNGFQDRLVMTASIPLRATEVFYHKLFILSTPQFLKNPLVCIIIVLSIREAG